MHVTYMTKMKNKKEEEFKDDGRSIANMNIDGFSWYNKNKSLDSKQQIILTKKEKKAIYKAMILKMIPIVIIALIAFTLSYFIIKLWLS